MTNLKQILGYRLFQGREDKTLRKFLIHPNNLVLLSTYDDEHILIEMTNQTYIKVPCENINEMEYYIFNQDDE